MMKKLIIRFGIHIIILFLVISLPFYIYGGEVLEAYYSVLSSGIVIFEQFAIMTMVGMIAATILLLLISDRQ